MELKNGEAMDKLDEIMAKREEIHALAGGSPLQLKLLERPEDMKPNKKKARQNLQISFPGYIVA